MKETQESRPRVYNGGSNRGVRVTTEHIAGSCGSTQTSFNGILNLSRACMDSIVRVAVLHVLISKFCNLLLELGKSAYKGQNGFAAPSPHSSSVGRTTNQQPSSYRQVLLLDSSL